MSIWHELTCPHGLPMWHWLSDLSWLLILFVATPFRYIKKLWRPIWKRTK